MNESAQIKQKLLAYHPERGDTADPSIEEAYTQAQADPELREFLAQERAFDDAFAAKLKSLQPPAGLKAQVLAALQEKLNAPAAPISAFPEPQPPSPENVVRPSFWRSSTTWSVAASILILIAAAALVTQNLLRVEEVPATVTNTYVRSASTHVQQISGLHFASDMGEIQSYLTERRAPIPAAIPPMLANLERIGCMPVEFDGVPAGLICFRGEDRTYHLYTIDKGQLRPDQVITEKQFIEVGAGNSAAVWSSPQQMHILITSGRCEEMETML